MRTRGRLSPSLWRKYELFKYKRKLYYDIALWEKTDGRDLFTQMPLVPEVTKAPTALNFGYGFGENLFALSNAYPNGKIYGIDCSPV